MSPNEWWKSKALSDEALAYFVLRGTQALILTYIGWGLWLVFWEWSFGMWRGLSILRWEDLDKLDPMLRAKIFIQMVLSWPHRVGPISLWIYGLLNLSMLGGLYASGVK